MHRAVKAVLPGSPAAKTMIAPGDILLKINDCKINDVLDYRYHSYEKNLVLLLCSSNGKHKVVRLKKKDGEDIGIEFESYLMDKERSCVNKCIFCFIDQLPSGMRASLYYKDDDFRLSFLQGNYVTLTNMSEAEIERVCDLRVSPINVSVHTTNHELRKMMLGGRNVSSGLDALVAFSKAGITLNCQIVCCPGINDGAELDKTIMDLINLGDNVKSVSVVPVGLTKHRDGLPLLRSYERTTAGKIILQVDDYAGLCLKRRGSRVFYCADEFYKIAGLELPPYEYYEDFPQLENGVGMLRLLLSEFDAEFKRKPQLSSDEPFTLVCGEAASADLTKLLNLTKSVYDKINGNIRVIKNCFFGNTVTVSGLLTGRDIIAQLSGRELGSRLLIARNMLRSGDDVFLDDVSVSEVSMHLGVEVRIVEQSGNALLHAFLGR